MKKCYVNLCTFFLFCVHPGKRSAELGVDTAAEPSFMRTASGGVFKVQGYTPNSTDILPPSRIQDLVYTSFSYDNSTVTLSWTAVGDDLDQGTGKTKLCLWSVIRGNIDETALWGGAGVKGTVPAPRIVKYPNSTLFAQKKCPFFYFRLISSFSF